MLKIKSKIKKFRERVKDNSCVNLIWIINLLPSVAGFPLQSIKLNVTFWIIHTALLFYVYISGIIVYQMYYVKELIDSVNSFFNISIFIMIFNTSWWLLVKRSALIDLLDLVQKNDDLITESGRLSYKHSQLLSQIKKILVACYVFHFVNDVCIFIPSRTVVMDDFAVASCVGLSPLTSTSDRIICMGILAAQELTGIVTVGTFDVTLLFLFSHTTAMFQILYEDVMDFRELAEIYYDSPEMTAKVAARMKNLVTRHSSILYTVQKLQAVYSGVIGIGFGLYAISMCLFFVLPLEVCLNFAPFIYHCLFVFFLYCYQGQRLTTASEKFEMAVYSCGWEHLRVKEQKTVLLLLTQAQKPVIILAASVIPIHIRTFAYTMQNIYKFVTIFKI